jgi:Xaa-Pro aminopeptidase/Xaa-Pro dipeptidase
MQRILITDADNWIINNEFNYLLGFQPTLGWIIISKNKIKIFLDSRYFLKTKDINQNNLLKKIWNKKKVIFVEYKHNLIKNLFEKIKKNTSIIIENNITIKHLENIKQEFGWKIIIKKPFFEKQRIIKQKKEIENIKKAIKIIDKVFIEIQKIVDSWEIIWKTELELRSFIITKIFEFGWEWESFESIVAYGSNSAIPHHTTWNTKIWNWPLLIDMWALYKWYCSDFTRTIWVWKTTIDNFEKVPLNNSKDLKNEYNYGEFKKIYDIVLNAYNKSYEYSKAWVKTKNIDKIARDYIIKQWYWEYFNHWLWHWVWLNIHEAPTLKDISKEKIEKWMVFTIEPWIYLPLNFWIRLENIVIVWEKWVESFSEIEM